MKYALNFKNAEIDFNTKKYNIVYHICVLTDSLKFDFKP